jgi:hypothetical protein
MADSDTDLQEVLETDEMEEVTAAQLLAPVAIHADPNTSSRSQSRLGMPIQDFYCGRFWSVDRKSLIPCGGTEGMEKRGRLYSKYLHKEMFSNTAEAGSSSANGKLSELDQRAPWKDSFSRVIKRLTLKDASTAAYEHGEGLVGREKELGKLESFLRAAIRGNAATGDIRSSIFLAGPPGVGTSWIADLDL